MKTIKEKQLDFLNDTISHYNSSNRSLIGSFCSYLPQTNKSLGCAIGRHVPDKELCKEFDKIGSVNQNKVFNRLPSELKELGQIFLREIQILHDNANNWNETGLTPYGKDKEIYIKEKFEIYDNINS